MSLREFTTAPPRRESPDERAPAAVVFDPLRHCVVTTVALLSWLVGPAVMVVAMSTLGLIMYWRALRAGLTRSRCVLGDTRFVMAYLAIACVAGWTSIGYRLFASGR